MEAQKTEKKFRLIFLIMSIIVCLFLLAGMILTFVLKSKQNDLSEKQKERYNLEQEYNKTETEKNYYESSEYNEEFYRNEKDYGKEGDKIIEIE